MDNKEYLAYLSKPYNTYEKGVQNPVRYDFKKVVELGNKIMVEKDPQNKTLDPICNDYEVVTIETDSGKEAFAIKKSSGNCVLTDGFNACLNEERLWPLFSTISILFEPNGWGTRFPILLKALCENSRVRNNQLPYLLQEIFAVQRKLSGYKIKDIYLDYNNKKSKVKCHKKEDAEDDILKFFTTHIKHENILSSLAAMTVNAIILNNELELKYI